MTTEAFPYPLQPWSDGQTAYRDNADGTRTVATYNQSTNSWRIQQVHNYLGDYFLVPNDINMGDGTKLTAKITALEALARSVRVSATQPATTIAGDVWFKSDTNQFYISTRADGESGDGDQWFLVNSSLSSYATRTYVDGLIADINTTNADVVIQSELDSAISTVNTSIAALPTQSDIDAAIAPLTSDITAANDSIDAKFDAFRSAVEGATDFTSLRTRLLAVLPE